MFACLYIFIITETVGSTALTQKWQLSTYIYNNRRHTRGSTSLNHAVKGQIRHTSPLLKSRMRVWCSEWHFLSYWAGPMALSFSSLQCLGVSQHTQLFPPPILLHSSLWLLRRITMEHKSVLLEPALCFCWSKSWSAWLSKAGLSKYSMNKWRLPEIGRTVGVWGSGKRHSLSYMLIEQTKCIAWFPGLLRLDHLSAPKTELNWHYHTVHTTTTVSQLTCIPLDRASASFEPSTDQEWVDSNCVDKMF